MRCGLRDFGLGRPVRAEGTILLKNPMRPFER